MGDTGLFPANIPKHFTDWADISNQGKIRVGVVSTARVLCYSISQDSWMGLGATCLRSFKVPPNPNCAGVLWFCDPLLVQPGPKHLQGWGLCPSCPCEMSLNPTPQAPAAQTAVMLLLRAHPAAPPCSSCHHSMGPLRAKGVLHLGSTRQRARFCSPILLPSGFCSQGGSWAGMCQQM